jgi:hypothetical protein
MLVGDHKDKSAGKMIDEFLTTMMLSDAFSPQSMSEEEVENKDDVVVRVPKNAAKIQL